jgi:heat shock protein HslJ/membrane-bound inhibitor of C-type lysozyme
MGSLGRVNQERGFEYTMHQKVLAATYLSAVLVCAACGPVQAGNDKQETTTMDLIGTSWQIEDIDQAGIVDGSMISLQFTADGRVAGSGGCNRYFGGVSLQGDQVSFSQLGSSRRACVPALMQQEQRFLAALHELASYRVDELERLLLFDANGAQRLRAVRIATDPTAKSDAATQPQDAALERRSQFNCDVSGAVEIRFVGPETLQLTGDGMTAILQRVRSASGARYAGNEVEFWNQGDDAMLNVNGLDQRCRRAQDGD